MTHDFFFKFIVPPARATYVPEVGVDVPPEQVEEIQEQAAEGDLRTWCVVVDTSPDSLLDVAVLLGVGFGVVFGRASILATRVLPVVKGLMEFFRRRKKETLQPKPEGEKPPLDGQS